MTVRELIEALQKFPPDAEVFRVDMSDDDAPYSYDEPNPYLSDDGTVTL